MNKPHLSEITKRVRSSFSEHSPEILTGIGIAGMLTTAVLAVKATPKALRLIEERKKEDKTLSKTQVVKTCWKCYIPAAVTGTLSTACLIGANSVNSKRNAALAAAYKLSETALTEYREKVIETVGEKKEQAVRDALSKDKVDKNPVSKTEVIVTGGGKSLFYDPTSDRYFESDLERIRRIVNDFNEQMLNGVDFCVSLNEFYSEIGLRYTSIGDELGWNAGKWGSIKVEFSAQIADDGRPCLVLNYINPPRREYSKLV